MTRIDRILCSIAAACGLAVAVPAAAQTELTVSLWIPPTHMIAKDIIMPWAADVEKATNGRVKFKLLPKAVANPIQTFDAIRDGLADVGFISHSYTPQRFQLTRIGVLPFSGDNAVSNSLALWRIYDKYLTGPNEHRGVHVLTLYTHGPGVMWNTKKAVTKIDDLAGLKFRVGGGMAADVGTAIGATVLVKPAPESYELLSSGVVDGVFFPGESIVSFKLEKLVKYATQFPGGLYSDSHAVMMNEAKWNALPAADKEAITKLSGEALSRRAGQAWDKNAEAGWSVAKANNVQVTRADAAFVAAVKARTAKFEQEWLDDAKAKGIDGPKVLAAYRAELKKLESGK